MALYVVFLHGPPAAGKHTVGSHVAASLGVPLFHNHLTVDLVKSLFDFGSAPFVSLRETIWLAAFREAATAGRSFVFTFNPETTVDPALIGKLQGSIEAAGGQVHFISLTCPDGELVQRMGNASRASFRKLTDPDLYQQLKQEGSFDFPPLPPPLLELDTSQLSSEQAAAKITDALRAAGV